MDTFDALENRYDVHEKYFSKERFYRKINTNISLLFLFSPLPSGWKDLGLQVLIVHFHTRPSAEKNILKSRSIEINSCLHLGNHKTRKSTIYSINE